ncbi:MAG: hypothetical protein P4M11_12020 [Candidatus Pacebacteria bacterium]|nr:hypothetical protein [Candidatus Paceibacterota bacterium]
MRDFEDVPLSTGASAASSSSSSICSSSSFSQTGGRGSDGQSFSHSESSRSERRRVGEVVEEETRWQDSNGNERIASKRGLARSALSVVSSSPIGEQRKIENLRGIRPEEVASFDSAWMAASQKFDPQHRLFGRTNQPALQSATADAPCLTESEANKTSNHDVKPWNKDDATTTPPKQTRSVHQAQAS